MALDIMAAFTNEPPELDFIWPGFLAGTVGALVAPGATGKSYWAMEAAMGIACSAAGGDLLGLHPDRNGKVVYFAGEDPPPALIRRIHSIGKHLSPGPRQAIAENLMLNSVMGARLNIMDESHLARIVEYSTGARLVIFDTLSRIHLLDENNNGHMAQLINVMEYVAAKTGAAILFLHHVGKSAAREGQGDQQQAARGASTLVDNARWAGFVAKMTEDESKRLCTEPGKPIGDRRRFYVRFGVSKQNYAEFPLDSWFERKEGGVLSPVELSEIGGKKGGGREQA